VVTEEKNTPTAARADDQSGYPVLGVELGHPATGVINTVHWPSRLGLGQEADNLLP